MRYIILMIFPLFLTGTPKIEEAITYEKLVKNYHESSSTPAIRSAAKKLYFFSEKELKTLRQRVLTECTPETGCDAKLKGKLKALYKMQDKMMEEEAFLMAEHRFKGGSGKHGFYWLFLNELTRREIKRLNMLNKRDVARLERDLKHLLRK